MNQAIMDVLDKQKPDWWVMWADPKDLQDLARGTATEVMVAKRTADRLFHPILHAALCAGLITEVKP